MKDDRPLPAAPWPGFYWVLPEQFLAGENPGGTNPEFTRQRLHGLLARGIRAFVDLNWLH